MVNDSKWYLIKVIRWSLPQSIYIYIIYIYYIYVYKERNLINSNFKDLQFSWKDKLYKYLIF